MKTVSFLAGFAAVSAIACLAIADERVALPNPAQTPGWAATDDLSQICTPGYARHERPSADFSAWLKRTTALCQGIPLAEAHNYEMDHFWPLCLGGAPYDARNLWLQPWPEARRKDRLEAEMCRQVCAHPQKRTLEDARRQMTTGGW